MILTIGQTNCFHYKSIVNGTSFNAFSGGVVRTEINSSPLKNIQDTRIIQSTDVNCSHSWNSFMCCCLSRRPICRAPIWRWATVSTRHRSLWFTVAGKFIGTEWYLALAFLPSLKMFLEFNADFVVIVWFLLCKHTNCIYNSNDL